MSPRHKPQNTSSHLQPTLSWSPSALVHRRNQTKQPLPILTTAVSTCRQGERSYTVSAAPQASSYPGGHLPMGKACNDAHPTGASKQHTPDALQRFAYHKKHDSRYSPTRGQSVHTQSPTRGRGRALFGIQHPLRLHTIIRCVRVRDGTLKSGSSQNGGAPMPTGRHTALNRQVQNTRWRSRNRSQFVRFLHAR